MTDPIEVLRETFPRSVCENGCQCGVCRGCRSCAALAAVVRLRDAARRMMMSDVHIGGVPYHGPLLVQYDLNQPTPAEELAAALAPFAQEER